MRIVTPFVLLLGLSSSGSCARERPDPRAQAAIERSRETASVYALYGWNWVRDEDGGARQDWSAEFHRGRLHRVETPEVRVVADCAGRTGIAIDLRTGETSSGADVAAAACGVSAHQDVLAAKWVGRRESRFGAVDMIELADSRDKRTYAIDDRGVLVAAEIFPSDGGRLYCVQNEAVAVESRLPEDDIFTEDSLSRSVVAERYRSAPATPSADLWLTPFSCF